jgi:heme exporter protein D
MNWSGPAEFFAMGGYGFYVWGSYAVFALCIAVETFLVIRRRNQLLRQLRQENERNP